MKTYLHVLQHPDLIDLYKWDKLCSLWSTRWGRRKSWWWKQHNQASSISQHFANINYYRLYI